MFSFRRPCHDLFSFRRSFLLCAADAAELVSPKLATGGSRKSGGSKKGSKKGGGSELPRESAAETQKSREIFYRLIGENSAALLTLDQLQMQSSPGSVSGEQQRIAQHVQTSLTFMVSQVPPKKIATKDQVRGFKEESWDPNAKPAPAFAMLGDDAAEQGAGMAAAPMDQ